MLRRDVAPGERGSYAAARTRIDTPHYRARCHAGGIQTGYHGTVLTQDPGVFVGEDPAKGADIPWDHGYGVKRRLFDTPQGL